LVVPQNLKGLANFYGAINRLVEAENYFKLAIKLLASSEFEPLKAEIIGDYASFLNKNDNQSAAIFYYKQAINLVQSARKNVSNLGLGRLQSFDKTVQDKYQSLADLLVEQGRLAEAQQVLSMIKEEEYFEFIRRDAGVANRLTTKASYISSEEPWIREYDTISARNANLGKELGELRNKAKYFPLNDEEKNS